MKKLIPILLLLLFTALTPAVLAQSTVSMGCSTLAAVNNAAPANYSYEFFAGDFLSFSVSGTGTFDITVGGNTILTGANAGSTTDYAVTADGMLSIVISVTGGDLTSMFTVECTPANTDAPDYPPGMLCHIPPGNPNAAHTITVGEAAVPAHLAHGDTEGPCPEGVNTRYDIPGANVAIYIIYATGEIGLYDNCTDTCDEEMDVPITSIINLGELTASSGDDEDGGIQFINVDNPEDYGFTLDGVNLSDGTVIVIYYLHPDPDNASIGVFQINVYQNGVLANDSILLFISTDGTILLWTDQGYWDRQANEED